MPQFFGQDKSTSLGWGLWF